MQQYRFNSVFRLHHHTSFFRYLFLLLLFTSYFPSFSSIFQRTDSWLKRRCFFMLTFFMQKRYIALLPPPLLSNSNAFTKYHTLKLLAFMSSREPVLLNIWVCFYLFVRQFPFHEVDDPLEKKSTREKESKRSSFYSLLSPFLVTLLFFTWIQSLYLSIYT